jgi:2-keto-3-deoxy-L-rhamnonate aldolase RhmA
MFQGIQEFRRKLTSGQLCLGAGITLSDAAVVEALAPGLDFVWIDLEHTHLSYESVQSHLIAARAGGIAALVRVRGSDIPHIKPVLDIGAEGIIVPQIRTADEVRAVVQMARYHPQGRRGYGPRRPANYGREGGPAYMQRANEQVFVAVQIENREALGNLESIAAIQGLDSLALGPYDLAVDLGHADELDNPEVLEAINRVIQVARKAGKHVGTGMGAYARGALDFANLGLQWIQCGDDYGYMVAHADELMAQIRKQAANPTV